MASSREASVASRTIVTTIGMAVQGLARFGYTWVIARFVGQAEVGEVNSLLSVAVYAALIWPQGAGVAAARFLPVPGESELAISWLRRSVAGMSVALAVAGGVVAWFLVGDVVSAVSCAILVATYAGYCFTRGVLLGRDRITQGAIWDIASSAASLGALVLVVVGDLHWALLLPLSAGYLLFTVCNWPRGAHQDVPSDLKRNVKSFTRDSCIAALASGGLLPSTMIMVQAFDTPVVAGSFAAAMSLATPANMLALALNQVLVPHFSRMRSGTAEELRTSFRRIFFVTGLGLVIVFGLLIAYASWILRLFFGETYDDAVIPMQILLAIVAVISLMAVPAAYLTATGYQRLYAMVWTVSFIIGSLVLLFTSPVMGQWGALLGYGIGGCGGSIAVIVFALASEPRLLGLGRDSRHPQQ